MLRTLPRIALLYLPALASAGCLERPDLEPGAAPRSDQRGELYRVGKGTDGVDGGTRLSVLTWNVMWLGDTARGPADEERQLAGVIEVLATHAADLIALQEVSSLASLQRVAAQLPGYGAAWTSHEWPQQMALLYRTERFSRRGAEQLLHIAQAGRPPLAVDLLDLETSRQLHVVVVHAKARDDAAAWAARAELAGALAAHLAARPEGDHGIVVGDFNDQLGSSISPGLPSPYAVLLAEMAAPTARLEGDAGEPSTVWGSAIDHVLLARALATDPDAWSADVLREELLQRVPEFSTHISDHFPVTVRGPAAAR